MKNIYLFTATLFLLLSVLSRGNSNQRQKAHGSTLETNNDSVYYRWGEMEGAATIGQFDRYDTSHVYLDHDFILSSDIDTVIIYPDTLPVDIFITNGKDTVFETIIFTENEMNKLREERAELLREYSEYGTASIEDDFRFYYSNSRDSNLVKLKEMYNLDSVAESGDEISRIINLMRWAHNVVRHDGNSTNPDPRDALNIISVCRKEGRGVNCRMMATILNEAYLAMGFKSRHVTCMPYDKEDGDCHVINIVFSESLNKWLYMDPTFEAYFIDKDSNIVSIEEARQMMIKGEDLIINDEINWNGGARDKNEHMSYMAKNLFRFSCPFGSEFGYESRDTTRGWIYLNPTGYDSELIGTADTSGEAGREWINYYTDNAEYFWAEP